MNGLYEQDCVLCLRSFEYCKTESENEQINNLEDVCSAYIKNDIETNNYDWSHLWMRDSPLCPVCLDQANKLWSLDNRLKQIEKDLSEFVKLFRNDILNCRREGAKSKDGDQTKSHGEEQINENEGCDAWSDSWDSTDEMESNQNTLLATTEQIFITSKVKEEKHAHSDDNCAEATTLSTDPLVSSSRKSLRVSLKRLLECPSKRRRPKSKFDAKYNVSKTESSDAKSESEESIQFEDIFKPQSKRLPKKKTKKKTDKKSTYCEICNAHFKGLNVHKSAHRGQTWECEMCDETFFSVITSRRRHMKAVHPEEEKIDGVKECEICHEKFKGSVVAFDLHCLEHKGEIPFECQSCHVKFANVIYYVDHFRFTSCGKSVLEKPGEVEKTFSCDLCDKVFNAKYVLLNHRLCHTNYDKSPVICEVCGKRFVITGRSTYLVERHFLSHTKEYPFPCDICGKRFAYVGDLDQHRLTHKGKQSKCDICGHTFVNPLGLFLHKKYLHSSNKRKVQPNKKKPFSCDKCGKAFTKEKGVLKHKFIEHGGENPDNYTECLENKVRNIEKQFHCDICSTDFIHKTNYTKHLKFHTEENPFQCTNGDCNQKFRVYFDLKEHYNTNPNCKSVSDSKLEQYKHICQICGKRQRSAATLRLHEMIHTGEKPFQCHLCGMSFNRKYHLSSHILKHENPYSCKTCHFKCETRKNLLDHYNVNPLCKSKVQETKRHKCDICEKRFFTKQKVLDHHQEKHSTDPVKPFQCQTCGKEFYTKPKLARHTKTHRKSVNAESVPVI